MIELFPEGFEEVDRRARRRARRLHRRGRRGAPLARSSARAQGADVEAGWEDRWRAFHRPIRVGRLWVGPPWEDAAGRRARRRHRPGPRVRHRRAPDDAALPRAAAGRSSRGRCSTSAAAPACSRSRRALLGFAPVLGVDVEEPSIEATLENARANGVELDARLVGTEDVAAAGGDVVVANISLDAVDALPARIDAETARHVGLLRSRSSRSSRATSTSTGVRSTAGRADVHRRRVGVIRSPRGDVPRRLSRLQGLARRRARGARGAAPRRPQRERRTPPTSR